MGEEVGSKVAESMAICDENWDTLMSLLPNNWMELAIECGVVKRLRRFQSLEVLLRVLLIHLVQGCSLRATAAIAQETNLAKVSDVAILKRLRSCGPWFQKLALALLTSCDMTATTEVAGFNIRAVDATVVREPGKTGSEWMLHYSVGLPGLSCDHFELLPRKGRGMGECLERFPAQQRDLILADRGYCLAKGMQAIRREKGHVIVRYVPHNLPVFDANHKKQPLLERLSGLEVAGDVAELKCLIRVADGWLPVRICAVRKTEEAIRIAQKKLKRSASKRQHRLKPETLEFAKYVMVLTTLERHQISARNALQLYRLRWQIELVFKRFKSIAGFGHLPKHDKASSKAWLHGKLFAALLAEKLTKMASSISPWGRLGLREEAQKSLERV